jgi:hypothetical protein
MRERATISPINITVKQGSEDDKDFKSRLIDRSITPLCLCVGPEIFSFESILIKSQKHNESNEVTYTIVNR